MHTRPPLVCVVDDDDSIRKALGRLLRSAGYQIEAFASAEQFLNRPAYQGPCCLVLDVHMPGLSGLSLQQLLSEHRRAEQIIFISGHGDIPMCAQALKAGAVDFLPKPFKDEQLLSVIDQALAHSVEILRTRRDVQQAKDLLDGLTPREMEVLTFVIAGFLNKQIADFLGTAEKTIKVHRGHIMEKLRFTSVAELVRFALQAGLQPARPHGTKVQ